MKPKKRIKKYNPKHFSQTVKMRRGNLLDILLVMYADLGNIREGEGTIQNLYEFLSILFTCKKIDNRFPERFEYLQNALKQLIERWDDLGRVVCRASELNALNDVLCWLEMILKTHPVADVYRVIQQLDSEVFAYMKDECGLNIQSPL